jgi:hypothetical protein
VPLCRGQPQLGVSDIYLVPCFLKSKGSSSLEKKDSTSLLVSTCHDAARCLKYVMLEVVALLVSGLDNLATEFLLGVPWNMLVQRKTPGRLSF